MALNKNEKAKLEKLASSKGWTNTSYGMTNQTRTKDLFESPSGGSVKIGTTWYSSYEYAKKSGQL